MLLVGGAPGLWSGTFAEAPLLVGSLGASATLLVLSPRHAFSDSRSLVLGNVIASTVGMLMGHVVPIPLLAAAAALSVSVVVQRAFNLTHPPAGGLAVTTALNRSQELASCLTFITLNVFANSLLLVCVLGLFNRFLDSKWTGLRRQSPHQST